jgi:hypothetical protein
MAKAIELTGQRFGRLIVINQNIQRTLAGAVRWDCVCDCGEKTTVIGSSLIRCSTTSCGCYQKEIRKVISKEAVRTANTTHGMRDSLEYNSWHSMIQRCTNTNDSSYKDYGGRGIQVCERWLNSFEVFYEDMGPRPSPDHTLDRRENDGNYEKNNCKWSTRKEQVCNRRNNVFYEYKGNSYTFLQLTELDEVVNNNICSDTLNTRIRMLKWSVEKAVNTPVRVMKQA